MTALMIGVLVVLVGSALCSGAEAVLFSVSHTKAQRLAETGAAAGRALFLIKEDMARPIASIVILNNVFNIVGSLVVGSIAATTFGDLGFGIFSAVLTLGVILFSEIVPKTLGERFSDRLGPIIALPVLGLTKLLTPLNYVIERLMAPLAVGKREITTDEYEIMLLARLGSTQGQIARHESEMIANVFRLDDITAEQLRTPRTSMTYLPGGPTLEELREEIVRSRHTRIPIIGEDLDDVVGYALRGDMLAHLLMGRGEMKVAELARDIEVVPPNLSATELLSRFRERREHIAIVLDEYGGTSGIVTMEDVIEVLTGPIVDETDLVENLQELGRRLARWRTRHGRPRKS
jgi:CBS domain containing-hemolysin-like protein